MPALIISSEMIKAHDHFAWNDQDYNTIHACGPGPLTCNPADCPMRVSVDQQPTVCAGTLAGKERNALKVPPVFIHRKVNAYAWPLHE